MTLRFVFDLLLYITAGFYWSDQTRNGQPADRIDALVFIFWPLYVAFMVVAVPGSTIRALLLKRKD